MNLHIYHLPLTGYQQAWDLQNQLAGAIAEEQHPPALLLLQHPHVYTFGRRGKQENLLWDDRELARRGVEVVWSDRGGDVTYHGPGQLVGYPILPLAEGKIEVDPENGSARLPGADYIGYLRKLEKTLILALARYGIPAGQVEGQTGVWVQPDVLSRCAACPPELAQSPAKIASIGVKVDARRISRHGFALNVSPDMSYWEGIVACGLENQNKASMAYFLDPAPEVSEVARGVAAAFAEVFKFQAENQPAVSLDEMFDT